MKCIPVTNEGYRLFHEGVIALSQVEANGFRIDTKYLKQRMKEVQSRVKELKHELKEGKECRPFFREMQKKYGSKVNLGSHDQVGQVLYGVFEHPGAILTHHGRYVTDKNVLQDVDVPFVRIFMEVEKLKKAHNTYLAGILREVDSDGFIHPFYNLHLARTYRSSADHPPVHQIPIRDEDVAALVRPCFIPRRPTNQIGEYDFSGIEVKVSGCYNKDPNLLKYIRDPKSDMHRDMAMQCYKLALEEVTKAIRYCAKNKFVFPEFYGDWFVSCAKALWFAIDRMNLCTEDGVPLKKHLREHGIRELGNVVMERGKIVQNPRPHTFMHHVMNVEKDFWGKRFKVYNQWKWDWYEEYLEQGYFDTYTGFRCSGFMDKKQCVNYPIQGSAFHCLLWCLIRIQKLLHKYHMRTLLIGQIHDSLLADIFKGELRQYLEIAHHVMTVELLKHWKWIIVPMDCEAEVASPGESWFKKEKVVVGV